MEDRVKAIAASPDISTVEKREAPSHGISGVGSITYPYEEELFRANTV
jgi:hypothetical protein